MHANEDSRGAAAARRAPAARARPVRAGSSRRDRAGGAGLGGAAAADRPARQRQVGAAQPRGRRARPRSPALQRQPVVVRRPARLPGAQRRARRTAVSAHAGNPLGRAIGVPGRDLALPARGAEQAVLDRARAARDGHRARRAALSLGGDEPAGRIRRRGRPGRHLPRLAAAGPGAGRPLRVRGGAAGAGRHRAGTAPAADRARRRRAGPRQSVARRRRQPCRADRRRAQPRRAVDRVV